MGWTYTTLTTAIKDFVQSTETTFTNNLNVFIQNAEERIFFGVSLEYFRKNQTGTLTSGNQYLAKPSDFMSSYALSVTVSGEKIFLLNKDVEYLQTYDPTGATGSPKYYGYFDINNFIIAPIPDDNYAVEIHYYYRPESIVTQTTGTWIGNNAQQALLYGSLVEAYTFLKGEPDLLNLYNQRFVESLTRLKNFGEGLENIDAYRDGLVRVKAS